MAIFQQAHRQKSEIRFSYQVLYTCGYEAISEGILMTSLQILFRLIEMSIVSMWLLARYIHNSREQL